MSLGENIRTRREALKLSQEYVAEYLGVSRQAVSKWETGKSEPTAANLVGLSELLEIGLSELVEDKKAAPDPPPKRSQTTFCRQTLLNWPSYCRRAFYMPPRWRFSITAGVRAMPVPSRFTLSCWPSAPR